MLPKALTALSLTLPLSAIAQNAGLVVRDGTIGPPGREIVQPGLDPTGRTADYLLRADHGKQVGGNLFHSFESFSIGAGETATFTQQCSACPGGAATGIEDVISRVTGGHESQIEGTLSSTIDGADVWLLNPAGVLFGREARLDLPSGLHVSTSDQLAFDTGETFEANSFGAVPVLEVARPEDFGFLLVEREEGRERIDVLGSQLTVSTGADLHLDGDISLEAGTRLSAPNGLVIIGGMDAAREARVEAARESVLELSAGLDAAAANPIDVVLSGARVVIGGLEQARGSTADLLIAKFNSLEPVAGATLRAAGEVRIEGVVRLDNEFSSGGRLEIAGDSVTIAKDGRLIGGETGRGISIDAPSGITIHDLIVSDAFGDDVGGLILLRSINGAVLVSDSGRVSADSGITIEGHTGVVIEGEVVSRGEDGLDINLDSTGGAVEISGSLELRRFEGLPGSVVVRASNSIDIEGSGTVAAVGGGDVMLDADQITIDGRIDASGLDGGGSVVVQGRNVSLGGEIRSLASDSGDAGSVTLTGDTVTVSGRIETGIPFPLDGHAGTVVIRGGRIEIQPPAEIKVDSDDESSGGSIDLVGTGESGEVIVGGSLFLGSPDAVRITARRVTISETGRVQFFPVEEESAAPVQLAADEEVIVRGSIENFGEGDIVVSSPSFRVDSGSLGTDIAVFADQVSLENGAEIFGNVRIRGYAADEATRVALSASRIQASFGRTVVVDAKEVRVVDGGAILADGSEGGPGDSEAIVIRAHAVVIETEGLVSSSGLPGFFAVAFAGESSVGYLDFPSTPSSIRIEAAREIRISSGGRIESTSFGDATAGSVELTTGHLLVAGTGSAISARTAGNGEGGALEIRAGRIDLVGGATISAASRALDPDEEQSIHARIENSIERTAAEDLLLFGIDAPLDRIEVELDLPEAPEGNAGAIVLTGERAVLSGGAVIETSAEQANGGNISITLKELLHLVGSTITANVGDGTGGNITIDSGFVIQDHSDIVARAGAGTGGEIKIVADVFIADPGSSVDASAGNPALSGTVAINAPDVDLAASLAQLSDSALDASDAITPPCSARRRGETPGSFVFSGRQGVPPGPEGALAAWPGEAAAAQGPLLSAVALQGGCAPMP